MSWPVGLSWTKTHYETVGNPDDSVEKDVRVQGGPFLWLPIKISSTKKIEMYLGFRPTAPWSSGYGNEGDVGTGFIGRLMKRLGIGNFGIALRIKEVK